MSMSGLMKAFVICILVLILGAAGVIGCEGRFNLGLLPDPHRAYVIGDTSYIEINPPLGGFESPGAIIEGNDHLIYIADHDRNETDARIAH